MLSSFRPRLLAAALAVTGIAGAVTFAPTESGATTLAAHATTATTSARHAPTSPWHKTHVVATGNQLAGPLVTRTSSGQLITAYFATSGSGDNTRTNLVWRILGARGWSRPTTAASGILGPRGFLPSIAATNQRVATLTQTRAGSDFISTLTEQTLSGARVVSHQIGNGTGSVALDAANTAAVVQTGTSGSTNQITATTVTTDGTVGSPVTLQTGTENLAAPVVVSTGRGTFVAAWLQQAGRVGSADDYLDTDTVRVARYSGGQWHSATTLTPHDSAVLYVGLVARGSDALLTYNHVRNINDSTTDLHALTYRSGRWSTNETVVRNTETTVGPWVQDIAANGTRAITGDRTYTQSGRSTTWRAGPAVPTFTAYCNSFDSSAYEGNRLHWFVITPTSRDSSNCQLLDYTLTSAPATRAQGRPQHATVHAGARQTISGSGFRPGEKIRAVLHSKSYKLGTYTATKAGRVTVRFTVPRKIKTGTHHVTLTGLTSKRATQVTFKVTKAVHKRSRHTAASTHEVALAATGSPGLPALIMGGVIALITGGLLLLGSRARTHGGAHRS